MGSPESSPAKVRARPPADWQGRLLPRSVLGISALILAAALGAAFSGAILYAYYAYRLDRGVEYASTFDERLDTALQIIESEQEEARAAVRAELEPLQRLGATGDTLEQLVERVAPSTFFLTTLDEAGAPSVGTGFVVFSDAERSFLLTSFTTIRAATRQPGPEVRARQGEEELVAEVVSWEEGRDLALLAVPRGGIDRLPWAETATGDRVFSISGLGGAGGSASQGLVGDVSAAGIQHDTPLGPQFQGAPLVNASGEVVAVSSRAYAPLGFPADDVFFAPAIADACVELLVCPEDRGQAEGVGGR
ncbi:MAG TPA: trypsin-like peptidase domain-containing protein [Acidimicrobiales bacterium]|nr:trypsin-like peptidase domain-containing protein [Acidimicrobiales bacterium]